MSEQVTIEESKEADTATGQASHLLSRALHNKVSLCKGFVGCSVSVLFYFIILRLFIILSNYFLT